MGDKSAGAEYIGKQIRINDYTRNKEYYLAVKIFVTSEKGRKTMNTKPIDVQNTVPYNQGQERRTCPMIAVNYTNFRNEMKKHLDQVTEDFETVIVTRKENKNVVIISEESYNNLLENIHVMGNKSNYDWLMESKRQLLAGKIQQHELIEDMDE